METFSALLAMCAGKSPVTGEFPAQKPVRRSFDVFFFHLRLNKRLSKQWRGWWFDGPLWRHYWDFPYVPSAICDFRAGFCLETVLKCIIDYEYKYIYTYHIEYSNDNSDISGI